MDLKLSGKKALITGSTSGIGYSIAAALAAEGACVIVNGRTQARVDAALTKLGVATAEGLVADLAAVAGAEIAFAKFPDVDILVNNLGIFGPKPFEEIPDEEWRRFFEVNVLSGVRLSRYYLPRMKAAGWGRIVFLSSASAVQIPTEMIHYGMSKAALLAVSRGMAETTAGTGVTVNCVLPGPTASEGVVAYVDGLAAAKGTSRSAVEAEFFKTMRPSSLLQRFATTEEVAAMVAYVASPVSAATNGAALRVEGGVVRSIV
ncbi:MAG: SDR family oxidoreductase [Bryobacteraceae bacterium]